MAPRILFVTSQSEDYLSACLWDGLQQVVGVANVVDAVNSATLQGVSLQKCGHIILRSRHLKCATLEREDEGSFDVLVINTCFTRDRPWKWCAELRRWLTVAGKIVVVDGGDSTEFLPAPPFPVDAYYKRELRSDVVQPYPCKQLLMAAPQRWVEKATCPRVYDAFFAGDVASHHVRQEMFFTMGQLAYRYENVVLVAGHLHEHATMEPYWELLRRSRVALCPPGAGSDCLRQWEAMSCGVLPIFYAHPPHAEAHLRTLFHPEVCGFVSAGEDRTKGLFRELDRLLIGNFAQKSRDLRNIVLHSHTTATRAKQVLADLGFPG